MKFKIDENLPIEVKSVLSQYGYDAETVYDEGISGTSDDNIFLICKNESRILITIDTDFASMIRYPPAECPGIIVLRLRNLDKHSILNSIAKLIPLLEKEKINHHLWIVEPNKIRIR